MAWMYWLLFACLCLPCQAQTLYKHIDKDGKVTYSDQAPGKDGTARALEIDKDLNVSQAVKTGTEGKPQGIDERIAQRQALRNKLRADIVKAQAKLDAAKIALGSGRDPRDDEWQPTISNPDDAGKPNAQGKITGRGGLVECVKVKNADGSERINCPAISVPNVDYPKRVQALEDTVMQAEEELRAAEQAYRRNAPD